MKEMCQRVMQDASHQKCMLEDTIMEESVPSMSSLGFSLMKLVRGQRSLRPPRRERKRMIAGHDDMAQLEILVNVLRATNVPVRYDASQPTSLQVTRGVCPFVEVTFQHVAVQTFVADGPHPTWNQELRLPCSSKCVSQGCSDTIYFNLFDQVVLDLLEDDRERSTTVHQQLQRCWLASLKVPFMALYLNGKVSTQSQIGRKRYYW